MQKAFAEFDNKWKLMMAFCQAEPVMMLKCHYLFELMMQIKERGHDSLSRECTF